MQQQVFLLMLLTTKRINTRLHILGGWECVEMVRRYAHLASNRLAEYTHHSQLRHTKQAQWSNRRILK